MKTVNSLKLQDTVTSASAGKIISCWNTNRLVAHVKGTSTTFTINFQASLDGKNDEDFFNVEGYKKSDITTRTSSVTSTGDGWDFDVTPYKYFRANVSSISDGNITIIANIIRE
jgi:hypothetical protein